MSKSIPSSSIFMTDTEKEIRRKISKAFCPEGEVEFNPLIDWAKYIVFTNTFSKLEVRRKKEFGGDVTYNSFLDLKKDYANKKLHPADLKNAMAEKLIEILSPAMKHFENPRIKNLKEKMDEILVTR
jgi:tyrosyl-tRNA synthetase